MYYAIWKKSRDNDYGSAARWWPLSNLGEECDESSFFLMLHFKKNLAAENAARSINCFKTEHGKCSSVHNIYGQV